MAFELFKIKKIMLFIGVLLFLVYHLQANILLKKPTLLSEDAIEQLAQNWNTVFSWKTTIITYSFSYEHRTAGFAIQLLSVPVYCHCYRFLPTLAEVKQAITSPNYYFTTPLCFQSAYPQALSFDELLKYVNNKKCIFYTGAGLSASAGVATMRDLEQLLEIDKGKWNFLKVAWYNPQKIVQKFASFCESMIYEKPTKAHIALKEIAEEKSVAIITENVDLLQQRTGVDLIFAYSDQLSSISVQDWQEVDGILCIGLSHDDRGLLAWYKQHNPNGKLIAIDLKVPNYLSNNDFIYQGDIQKLLPLLAEKVIK